MKIAHPISHPLFINEFSEIFSLSSFYSNTKSLNTITYDSRLFFLFPEPISPPILPFIFYPLLPSKFLKYSHPQTFLFYSLLNFWNNLSLIDHQISHPLFLNQLSTIPPLPSIFDPLLPTHFRNSPIFHFLIPILTLESIPSSIFHFLFVIKFWKYPPPFLTNRCPNLSVSP